MRDDILRKIAQEQGKADVYFTTMIDLYAIDTNSPGFVEAEKLRHLPEKRVEALEQAFAADIAYWRFIPYIQLHEYEAYLFSDPTQFRLYYPRHEHAIKNLLSVANAHAPERINDGPTTAPSKRIIAQLPGYERAKTVVGPEVAELIGLEVIRSKCPHFAAWLTRLEQLGVKSGDSDA